MSAKTADLVAASGMKNARLPASYVSAQHAIAKCAKIDECKEWDRKADALASYARQAGDDSLLRMAQRIKARAIERCGALMKEMPEGKAGRPGKSASPGMQISRSAAAREAGLSKNQKEDALRVATFKEKDPALFEKMVESETPPTIKELAKLGTKRPEPRVDMLEGRNPEDFNRSLYATADISMLVVKLKKIEVDVLLRGCTPDDIQPLASDARFLHRYMAELAGKILR